MKPVINQNVAILCDGNNIERSIQEKTSSSSTMVNFDKVIPKLLNGRGLNRLIYFREGRNISSKLAERLHENFFGSVVPCHKSADIPLSIKATQLASKVDTIIIMSGDSDYVELVRYLKNEGVRVEIAAVRANSAKILLDEADYFHPITEEDWFEYTKPKAFHKKHYRHHGKVDGNESQEGQENLENNHNSQNEVKYENIDAEYVSEKKPHEHVDEVESTRKHHKKAHDVHDDEKSDEKDGFMGKLIKKMKKKSE